MTDEEIYLKIKEAQSNLQKAMVRAYSEGLEVSVEVDNSSGRPITKVNVSRPIY